MRKINLLAAGVALAAAASILGPQGARAYDAPVPPPEEELWGYCCATKGAKCCSRGGCEIHAGGCTRL